LQLLTIILPALNEQEAVEQTIRDFALHFPEAFLIVVDNGSQDSTRELAKRVIKKYRVNGVVSYEKKRGKVNAVRHALLRFQSRVWILADCDATYPADGMRRIYEKLLLEQFDQGVADRLTNNSYINKSLSTTTLNRAGNYIFTKFTQILTTSDHTDVFSGGRVLTDPLIRSICFQSKGFQLEMDLTLQCHAIGADTVYMPIDYKRRPVGSQTKLKPFRDGASILAFLLKTMLITKAHIVLTFWGFLFFCFGLSLGIRLLFVFAELGNVPYSSTAVLVSLFLLLSVQLFACALLVRSQKTSSDFMKILDFQNRKHQWNVIMSKR
jgi:glycosyltransferase involved in cell wall biosynthesis